MFNSTIWIQVFYGKEAHLTRFRADAAVASSLVLSEVIPMSGYLGQQCIYCFCTMA